MSRTSHVVTSPISSHYHHHQPPPPPLRAAATAAVELPGECPLLGQTGVSSSIPPSPKRPANKATSPATNDTNRRTTPVHDDTNQTAQRRHVTSTRRCQQSPQRRHITAPPMTPTTPPIT